MAWRQAIIPEAPFCIVFRPQVQNYEKISIFPNACRKTFPFRAQLFTFFFAARIGMSKKMRNFVGVNTNTHYILL